MECVNCLSNKKFANLKFVDISINQTDTVALFDTGASMSAISRSLLSMLNISQESCKTVKAGNNNGHIMNLQTAVLPKITIGNVNMDNLTVLVIGNEDFNISDGNDIIFPA